MATNNGFDDNGADLETLNKDTLRAPESRIKDIMGVRSRISELREGDKLRSQRRTKVQWLIDGNRPYPIESMRKAGRGDDANINFREAEGMVEAATTPFYELCFGVPRAANIEVDYTGATQQYNYEWGEKISERYSKTLWGWKGYKVNKQISHYQMSVFGRGPIIRPWKRGWHFKAKKDSEVWVSDDADCDLDLLPEAALPGYFEPTELFRLIDKKNIKGWAVKMAKLAIVNAAPEIYTNTYGKDWSEQFETSLRRGDTGWQNKKARIPYVDYLVKEFDGKISHAIVLDEQPPDSGEDNFLFKKVGRFDSFHQIITPYFFDVGPDGQWYSVNGLGQKIFDFCDLSNKFTCTLINAAAASAGVPVQARNAQAMEKAQATPAVRANGMTMFSNDWELSQINMRGQLDGPLAVKRDLSLTLQANTGQYRQRVNLDNQEPTLGQAQMNATQQATLTRGSYDRYYDQDDDEHEETLRRMLDPSITDSDPGGKEAKKFIEDLVNIDKVPREILSMKYICSVKAVRNVGYGSPQMQEVVSQRMMQRLMYYDEDGRNHVLRMVTANDVGQSNVDRFVKPIEDAGIPNDQVWAADMENNVLRQQGADPPVITANQNPVVHITEHMKAMLGDVEKLKQGQIDPFAVLTFLDAGGPHVHDHLQSMEGDPTRKDQLEQFTKMFAMLAKLADQLKADVEKAQAEQQPAEPQPDPKAMEGLVKALGEIDIKRKKMEAGVALNQEKFQHQKKLKDMQAADKIIRNNMESQAMQPAGRR